MSIPEFAVKRPITMLMIIVSVLVIGLLSLNRLPLTFFPEFSSSHLRIDVPYPSSSPQEVERLITKPIEDMMGTVTNLESMSSSSSGSGSNVNLEFVAGTDMDLASVEVRDRIDRVRSLLPDDVERVNIRRWQTTDMPVFQFSVAWNKGSDALYDLVNKILIPQLQRIEGVANVDIRGMDERKVLVELDLERMRAHQLDFFQLASSLRQNNINVAGGTVMQGGREFSVRTIGEYRTVEEIAETPIRGSSLVLRDVASVKFAFPEKTRFGRLNKSNAVDLQVYKASTANVIDVAEKSLQFLNELKQESKYKGVEIQVYRDQSDEIKTSLLNLTISGLLGAVLAVLILYFFLRKVRSTIIIAMAIPISIITTFLLIYLLRMAPFNSTITINIVSLSGLMFAVGMLVDPAVVVLENIFRHKQEEKLNAIDAAIVGAKEVAVAVTAAVLTTVIVFVPMLFMEGGGFGRWMGDFGVAICVASIASLLMSLTLIPLASSFLFTGEEKQKNKLIAGLSDGYAKIIGRLVRFPVSLVVLLFGIGLLWGTWYLKDLIDRDWMPRTPSRRMDLGMEIDRNFSIDEVHVMFDSLENILLKNKQKFEIDNVATDYRKRGGRLTIYFIPEEDGQKNTTELYDEIRASLPEFAGVEFQVGRRHGRGGNEEGVSIELKGESLSVLRTFSEEIRHRLQGIDGIKDIDTSLERGDEELQVTVDRVRSQNIGLSAQDVARSISSALGGRSTSRFKAQDREVDILMQLAEEDRTNRQQLENMALQNSEQNMVQVSSVADMQLRKGPQTIEREDRRSTVTVFANTDSRGMFSVSREINKRLADLNLPPGYSWSLGRNFQEMQQGEQDSMFAIWLAVILIYIVMASLFESFIHPFTIMFSVPFALSGVFLMFWLTDTNLTTMGWLGILVVCGLVVNNGIILIDAINKRRRSGFSRTEAIIIGGKNRVRPILMTTLTTILGLAPLVIPAMFPQFFGPQEGRSGMYSPVGIAIVGGLVTSTPLTLFIIPVVYVFLDDLTRWAKNVLDNTLKRSRLTTATQES
ncbi:MAG: efflux RND transporter permease subunit [Deferribacteres bacterium]|nr:efflux RND transporter permease subunit [Deferribacteres bacterium]